MAVALANLINSSNAGTGSVTTQNTASITCVSGAQLVAWIGMRSTDGLTLGSETLQLVGPTGVTWTIQIAGSPGTGVFATSEILVMFVGTYSGTPSGTVAISCVSGRAFNIAEWSIDSLTGASATPVVQMKGSAFSSFPNSVSETLSAFGSANNVTQFAYCMGHNTDTATVKTSYTALGFTSPGVVHMADEWRAVNDTTPSFALTGGTNGYAMAVELQAASGAKVIPPGLFQR